MFFRGKRGVNLRMQMAWSRILTVIVFRVSYAPSLGNNLIIYSKLLPVLLRAMIKEIKRYEQAGYRKTNWER